MKTLPFNSARKMTVGDFATLQERFRQPLPSPWPSRNGVPVTAHILPLIFGDGKQPVILSFYDDPETCILVLFDSTIPLDLDLTGRCEEPTAIRCFRDALDEIYEACEDQWSEPPGLTPTSKIELRGASNEAEHQALEADEQDGPTSWDLVLRGGGTWCIA